MEELASRMKLALLSLFVFALVISNTYYYFFWLSDDAYISFRYVIHFFESGKLFYNHHELKSGLVQGFSNPSMLLIYYTSLLLPFDAMLSIKLLGTLTYLGICLVCYLALWKMEITFYIRALAILSLSVSPILGLHASSGMETIFLAFGVLISWYLYFFGSGFFFYLSAVALAFSVVMRPEGFALIVIAVTLHSLYSYLNFNSAFSKSFKSVLWLFLFLTPVISYHTWQYATYGSLVSNTAKAKASNYGILSFFGTDRYKYIYDFFIYNPCSSIIYFVGLLFFILQFLRRSISASRLTAYLLTIPGFLVSILATHDYFQNYRYIAPYYALFILATTCSVHDFIFSIQKKSIRTSLLIALTLLYIGGVFRDIQTEYVLNNKFAFASTVDLSKKNYTKQQYFSTTYWASFFRQTDLFLLFAPENSSVVYGNIGRPGILARDVDVIDSVGLVTEPFARYRTTEKAALVEARSDIEKLFSQTNPGMFVSGVIDYPFIKLIEDRDLSEFTEVDWLNSDYEKLYIKKSLIAEDGGSIVPPKVVLGRIRSAYKFFYRDYLNLARYQEFLYLNNEIEELSHFAKKQGQVYGVSDSVLKTIQASLDKTKIESSTLDVMPINSNRARELKLSNFFSNAGLFKLKHLLVSCNSSGELNFEIKKCVGDNCEAVTSQRRDFANKQAEKLSFVFDRLGILSNNPQIVWPEMIFKYLGLESGKSGEDSNLFFHGEEVSETELRMVVSGAPLDSCSFKLFDPLL